MNDRNIISNLWNEITRLVVSEVAKKQCDKTFKSTIWKINENNTYSINYKGQLYDIPNASGIPLSLGQSVWIKIPNGILRNMYIDSVPNVIMSSSSGGGDGHTHNNKTILDNITSTKISSWDNAEQNVQSDWVVTDESSDAYIKNKPSRITNEEIDSLFD